MRRATALKSEDLARIASVTHLDNDGASTPTVLRLVGEVGPVLQSTCAWTPEDPGAPAGNIRAIDFARDAPCSGLGAGAFGSPPERAVSRLGEFVMIGGTSWWTPAATPTRSRAEAAGAPILTPFLLQWEDTMSAVATLRSSTPVPLVHWYEYLLRRITYPAACDTGIIVMRVIANMPARLIVDKHLARPPLQKFRPRDGELIINKNHIGEYFRRNAVAQAYGDDAECTVIMVGVAAAPATGRAAMRREFARRSFYATPSTASALA